jgi:uncharacterized protein (TIGR02147 family)
MKKRSARPVMFTYRSSHVYLADLINWYKEEGVSMRNLARKLSVSPSLLCLIIKGQRLLTPENVDLWSPVLGWNSQETSWLKNLVDFETQGPEGKEKAFKALMKFQDYQERSPENVVTFRYLKKWWNVAIREMSELQDFVEDPGWISERLVFKVPLNEIRKSLVFLNKHGLLAKHGKLRSLNCDGEVYKLSLSGFHDQMLGKAVESIYKIPSEERYILGHTMSIPTEKFDEAKMVLEEALAKISALREDGKNSEDVYHFSFLGFPLTKEKAQ